MYLFYDMQFQQRTTHSNTQCITSSYGTIEYIFHNFV